MKTKSIMSMMAVLAMGVMLSCSSGNTERTDDQATSAATSHPKGQASVSDNVSDRNILQVAVASDAHTTLVAAVEAAQIEHVLVNAGPLTVFAPTNEAFNLLPEGVVENLLKPENKSDLATTLTRHAAPGSFDLEALKREASKGRKIYMATGDYLEVKVDGDNVSVGGANILATISTSNGIIHVIDKVIASN
ncbi:fasciclin domain-containing protein [Marinoscillum sp. 108]|uniref:Fasciclin domain-containing protein n=1 Tax=Marinoscillum luteum TaxID=861051 RepID=A0ABW7NAH9_9BACT|nr:fasciclin domain-containing protein [Marinoscillum sp. 108]